MENDWAETSRKRRDRLYIIAEILIIARNGSLKTQIMYGANLSFAQLEKYCSFLLKRELLKKMKNKGRTLYKTTPKGFRLLEILDEITSLLAKEGKGSVQRNWPIFWKCKSAR